MVGTNDAAVISGTSTATISETNSVQSAVGTLSATDVDSAATFTAQTAVAGSNGYGSFSITTGGVWTYSMGTAHNEFVGGSSYSDSEIGRASCRERGEISVGAVAIKKKAVNSGTSKA